MSFRLKLALAQVVVLVVTLGAVAAIFYLVLHESLVEEVDEGLRLRATEVARDLAEWNGPPPGAVAAPTPSGQLAALAAPDVRIRVLDAEGRMVASSPNPRQMPFPNDPGALQAAYRGEERYSFVTLPEGQRVRLLTAPVVADGAVRWVVQVAQSLHQVDATMRSVVRLLGIVVALAAVLSFFISQGVTASLLAPIGRITATARRITQTGDFSQRVPAAAGDDELAVLGRTINAMVERLERLLESQRQLLADTSHELRTPLTVIRGNLELLRRELDPDLRAECLAEAESEAARMSRLVGDLLFLAQADARLALRLAPIRLDELVCQTVALVGPQATDRRLEIGALDETIVEGDADRLKQLLLDLLDNALRYTRPGDAITVELHRRGPEARLVVRDTGPGIALEHLPRIFDRFYRVDPARSRGGSGLGLTIVKHVAEAHGGRVEVASAPGVGTTFTVHLRAQPSWTPVGPAPDGLTGVPRPPLGRPGVPLTPTPDAVPARGAPTAPPPGAGGSADRAPERSAARRQREQG